MKRHIQKTGVRRFFGQDLVELQAEPLKALDAFFAEYGACLIEGCAITEADGGTFTVARGLVALACTDPDSGAVAVRTMPFAGAEGVALPLYLSANWKVVERVYDDGKVKPIGYDLSAVASGIAPEAPHLVLTAAGGHRFVDAVQDPAHRFISEAERTKWNAILQQAKEYAAAQAKTEAASAQSTAVGVAKGYTDAAAAALRDEQAIADAAGLRSAKAYADRIVAALVDGSPELLNTLEELAAALGNDPHFAATVTTEIGKRVKTTDFTAAMANKAETAEAMIYRGVNAGGSIDACTASGYYFDTRGPAYGTLVVVRAYNNKDHPTQVLIPHLRSGMYTRSYNTDAGTWSAWVEVYHTGNLGVATTTADGLMSKEDKTTLNSVPGKANASETLRYLGTNVGNNLNAYTQTGYGFDTRGPMVGTILSLAGYQNQYHPSQLLLGYGNNRVMYRSLNHDTSSWSPWAEFHTTGNLKIIRGAVAASGGLIGGSGFDNVQKVGNYVRVYHYLGHVNYSATASAHSSNPTLYDNVVSVAAKYNNYVDFVITDGPGNNIEFAPFDFIIIPW